MTNLSAPPINHIFVDCENVHALDHSLIGRNGFFVTVMMGATQTKLDGALVEKLLENAASVHLVRLTSKAKNALDFAIAYYLGNTVITNPTRHYHIVSKDKGFDPLIEHLSSRHIKIRRHDDFSELTSSAATKSQPARPADTLTRVLEHFGKNPNNRPKRKARLASYLRSFCGKGATAEDALKVIEDLINRHYLRIDEKGAVAYHDERGPDISACRADDPF